MPEMDLELVRHALKVARRNGFTEVELEVGEGSFSATLKPLAPGVPLASDETAKEPEVQTVTSTLVGYYRPAKQPLEVGRVIHRGDVVAVVAALGIANDVESKVEGEVVEVLVEPDEPVEFGQPLARVRPI